MPYNEHDLEYVFGKQSLEDTRALNEINGVGEVVTARNVGNLLYISNALAGEAGEAANIVKKICRDGNSPKLMIKLGLEMVDVLIYLHIMADISNIDLERAWRTKFIELESRFKRAQPKDWYIDQLNKPLYEES